MIESTVSSTHDSLSAALMKMKLRAFTNVALDAGGNWGLDFPAMEGLRLNVIHKGECWVAVDGEKEGVHLRAGDCFLLTGSRRFVVAKNSSIKKRVRAEALFSSAKDGVVTTQGGGDTLVVGTLFRFEGHLPPLIFGRLPPLIPIAGHSDQAVVLRWSLDRFGAELRGGGGPMGRSLMLNHLAPIMLLQTLRIYLSTAKGEDNWLTALSDERMANVLDAMHADYPRAWSLEDFAKLARMSRSGFALTFKKKIGVSPMDYLASWRMQVACELLAESDRSVGAVASDVGYASESAFSVAFHKIVKCRPGAYRARRDLGITPAFDPAPPRR